MEGKTNKPRKKTRLCFICSSGGHLAELLPVGRRLGKGREHFWITFKNPMTENTLKDDRYYMVHDPIRNPLIFLKLIFHSFFLFMKERPDVVITTGAGMAVPFSIIAKLFGKKLVFIESFCRTESPSLSGKALYTFADKFYVQWENNLKEYGKKAEFFGSVY
jgi:UDP-N-acetylglucosamine:LPS N-acetylglucosamine transferase